MIERQFVSQKVKEYQIQEYIKSKLIGAGYSHTEIQRTPLGEKIIIYTARPGLVVGRKGENIKKLTTVLHRRFKIENPQIEIGELDNPMLDVNYVVDKISSTLLRFGSKRFKSIGYKTLQEIIDSGALGAEIVISGKVPSSRARSWRFKAGLLKKSGNISQNKIKKCVGTANLKSGVIGIKVSIMTPDIILPDRILILDKETKVLVEKKEIDSENVDENKVKETMKTKTIKSENVDENKVKETMKTKTIKSENVDENKDLPEAFYEKDSSKSNEKTEKKDHKETTEEKEEKKVRRKRTTLKKNTTEKVSEENADKNEKKDLEKMNDSELSGEQNEKV